MITQTSENPRLMLDLDEGWPERQHLEFRLSQSSRSLRSKGWGSFAWGKLRYSGVFFCFTSIAKQILQIKLEDTVVQSSSSHRFSILLAVFAGLFFVQVSKSGSLGGLQILDTPFFSSTRLPFTQILDFQ